MMTKKSLLAILATAGLGLAGALSLFTNKNPTLEDNLKITNKGINNEQGALNPSNQLQHPRKEVTLESISEEIRGKSLEDKYNKYTLKGYVLSNSMPLQEIEVNAGLSQIVGVYPNTKIFSSKTDNLGRFTLRVPNNAPYTVEARHIGNRGQVKTRDITAVAEKEENAKDILIKFGDSPDIQIILKGQDRINNATLQTNNKNSLEGMIRENSALFEDVESNKPYSLVLTTKDGGIITDTIPVFYEDVTREYKSPEISYGQIQVVDSETMKSINGANLKFTLPEIDEGRFTISHTTNADGIWNGWMSEGNYILNVRADNHCENTSDLKIPSSQTQTVNKIIKLKTGRVIEGIVTEGNNIPVEGVKVYLLDALSKGQSEGTQTATTNENGVFTLVGIDPNRKPPYSTSSLQTYIPVAIKSGYFQSLLEEITLSENRNNLRIRIEKPDNTLEGRVVGIDGKPVQSLLNVQLRKIGDTTNVSNAPFWINKLSETNPDGHFAIEKLPAGTYRIIAQPDDELYIRTVEEVNIPSSNKITLKLKQGIPIEGHVLDKDTGARIGDVNLRLYQRDSEWELITRTDNDGRFRSFVPNGEIDYFAWLIDSSKKGFIEETQGKLYPINGSDNTVLLKRKPYVSLNVRDEGGNPIQLYNILILEERPNGNYATNRIGFDENGATLIPIKYPSRVFVSAKGYSQSERIEIKDASRKEIYTVMKKN